MLIFSQNAAGKWTIKYNHHNFNIDELWDFWEQKKYFCAFPGGYFEKDFRKVWPMNCWPILRPLFKILDRPF